MTHLKPGRLKLLRDPRLGGAAVADKHVPALAKHLERIDELMIVHFIDCGMDCAAAAIGVV
jgi:hypothetical protein